LRGPLHNRGVDDRCIECGELFPCPTSINEREMSHRVAPSATVLAHDFEHQLRAIRDALKPFERELRQSADKRKHVRADAVAVAIEHLQQAMDALEVASKQ
jgi:hypothetical protein